MPSRDDLLAARKAAIDCANASGSLLWFAAGGGRLTPVQEQQIGSLLDQERWESGPRIAHLDSRPFYLPVFLCGLCEALASGWGVISKVEDDLIREAPAPATAGGMTRPSAHRLAWDFARHLWVSIRDLDFRLDPQWECLGTIAVRRFDLDLALAKEHLPDIVAELATKPRFDFPHVIALIKQESVRAIDRLESARDAPPPSMPEAPASPAASPRGDGLDPRLPRGM